MYWRVARRLGMALWLLERRPGVGVTTCNLGAAVTQRTLVVTLERRDKDSVNFGSVGENWPTEPRESEKPGWRQEERGESKQLSCQLTWAGFRSADFTETVSYN